MAGITVTLLANGRLDADLTGYAPNFTGICPYVNTIRLRKRIDGLTIDIVYDDNTQLTVCAHTDAPIAGVLLVEFLNGVEMTSQTMLYDALKIL